MIAPGFQNESILHIAILRLEDRPPQQLPTRHLSSPILGYWITFKADIVSGSALLVPAGDDIEEIRRRPSPQEAFVETDARAYEDFRLLEDSNPQVYRSEPLPNPGDYELTGEVTFVHTEDTGDKGDVRVVVESCPFDLGVDDTNCITVEVGAWVQFRVRELALFEYDL